MWRRPSAMPSCPASARSSPSHCRLIETFSSSSSPTCSTGSNHGDGAGRSASDSEEVYSLTCACIDGSTRDVAGGAENVVAPRASHSVSSVHDNSADDEWGCDGAVAAAIPPESLSSRPSSTPATETVPRTGHVGRQGDGQHPQLDEQSARSKTHQDSQIPTSMKKGHSGGVCTDHGDDRAELLLSFQPSSPLITYMQSSSDIRGATDVPRRQHIHSTPPAAINVVPPHAHTQRGASLQRAAISQPLPPSPSTLSVRAVAPPAFLSKSSSHPETQRTRSSSPSLRSPTPLDLTAPPKGRPARHSNTTDSTEEIGEIEDPNEDKNMVRRGNRSASLPKLGQSHVWCTENSSQSTQQSPRRLSFSVSSAVAPGNQLSTEFQAEADAFDKGCVAPSPPTSLPAGQYSGANASGAQAGAAEAIETSSESKPPRMSTAGGNSTLASAAFMTVSKASLTPEAAVVRQQKPLSSSPSRHLSHELFASPEPVRDVGSPTQLQRRRPSSAVRQSIRGAHRSIDGSVDDAQPCVPRVIPTHDSVFFPVGTDVIAPVVLHYLTIAGWSTTAGGRDYFSHRRLRGGEVAGHTVRWLHTAKPRDQFVFLVTPVINREEAALECDEVAAVAQRLGCRSSSIAATSSRASGCEHGAVNGSELDILSSRSSAWTQRKSCDVTGAATNTTRWRWYTPAKLLQGLRARVFGEAPWFTHRAKNVCAYSLIAQMSDDDSLSVSDAATPSGDSLSDPSKDDNGDSDGVAGSASESRSCSDDAFWRSPHMQSSAQCLCQSPLDAPMAEVSSGGVHKGILAHGMSPARFARKPSQSPPASVVSAASSLASSSPRTVRLAFPSPGRQQAATQNALPSVVPARSNIYSRYVWSPITGTASAASPVTPQQPLQSPIPAAAAVSPSRAADTSPVSVGVEVIVMAHADITAMDYAPRLTSHRLSIEAKAAHTYFFPLLSDALAFYQCEDAMELMEEQWAAGVTSQIPRSRTAALRYQRRKHPRRPYSHLSVAGVGSGSRGPSVRAAPLPYEDGDSPNPFSSSSRGTPKNTANAPRRREGGSTSDSARHTVWGSEVGSDSTTTGMGLSGTPLGPHQHQQLPHCTPALAHPPMSLPSQSLSLSDALRRAQSMGNLGFSSMHDGGPLGISSSTTVRPPTPLPHTAAEARVTPASAPAAPHLAPTSQSQPSCRSLVQPRLTSSHGEVVVSVYTADPVFNAVLREVLVPEPGTHPYTVSVAEQKRLLSMVEVGMPAWCIFYSSTGLPYRRLFRLLYSSLTNLWPLLSLTVGLYDLYKHLPQLKRFMEHTLEPITRWVEQRFTIRVSVLVTYLISVVVTICSSLSSFVSQFYVVQLFSLPIVQLVLSLLKLPFVIAFDATWTLMTTVLGTVSLVLQVVRMVFMAPFMLVVNVASLRETFGAAAPVAVDGTSVLVKQWREWMEFWQTVASPMKNAARAWWDSMMHVSTSAARREMSIRRWTSPKLEQLAVVMREAQDCITINAHLWWTYILLPGIERKVLLSVMLVYLYWLFLGISPELWDEVIYASGVRDHPALRRGQAASQMETVTSAKMKESLESSSTLVAMSPADSHRDAPYKDGSIGKCDGDMCASALTTSVVKEWRLYAYLHNVLRGSGNHSSPSPSSTSTQPPSAASSETGPSSAVVSGAPSFTFRLEPQETFPALVVELLLPNMVLELLHQVRSALVFGWYRAVAVWSRMATGRVDVLQRSSPGEADNNSNAGSTVSFQ
ncbi:hypothetical protein, conserved [Leishmania tarentolae]|uniref:Uncharacterized protein n=1 Tax=Leishmania tarentolae TaxID=5689 RepID=A0A640KC23_LEITA|nr:hypothetical protein, conserved [Leishmania tarentolae]